MDHALLHRFIQRRNRLPEHLFRRRLVALRERFAQLPQGRAQTRRVGPVPGGSFLSLTGAFQRRKMISHGSLFTFARMWMSLNRQADSNLFILRE